MIEASPRAQRTRGILLTSIVLVLIVGGILVGVAMGVREGSGPTGQQTHTATPTAAPTDTSPPSGDKLQPTPAFGSFLPEAMGGEEAIDALGDNLEAVANRNGKTPEELKDLLLRDKSAKVSVDGFIVYGDSFEN